jgi:hypothetical protein
MNYAEREELESRIAELKQLLVGPGPSPDARVTGLAAVVQAEALLLLVGQLETSVNTLVHDGLMMLPRPDR